MKLSIKILRDIGFIVGLLLFAVVVLSAARANALSDTTLEELTNMHREQTSLSTLSHSTELAASAERKAQDMFARQYWAHNSPDGNEPWSFISASGYEYKKAGENLARDFVTDEAVVNAWLASETHRANVLSNEFTEIGVAVVTGYFNNQTVTFVVAHYGQPKPSSYREPTDISMSNGVLSSSPPFRAGERTQVSSFSRFWKDLSRLSGSLLKLSVF